MPLSREVKCAAQKESAQPTPGVENLVMARIG